MSQLLTVEEYTEKSIVVRGDTKTYKDDLARLNGKYNANLKNGAGWIYSKKNESAVKAFVDKVNSSETVSEVKTTATTRVKQAEKVQATVLTEEAVLQFLSTYSVEKLSNFQKKVGSLLAKVASVEIDDVSEEDDVDEMLTNTKRLLTPFKRK